MSSPDAVAARPRLRVGVVLALIALGAVVATRVWFETLPFDNALSSPDLFHEFYPVYRYVGEEYAAGRLPLWNPYLGLGTSEVADIQNGLFYPPTWIFVFLPPEWGIEVSTILHLTIAAIGVLLLARTSGLSLEAALLGAIALAAAEPLHKLSGWPPLVAGFSWCPLAFYAARRVGDRPGLASALFLTAILALQILAGYPQFHLYTVLCLPLFAAPWVGFRFGLFVRVLVWLAVAEIWAAAIAGAALVPAIQAVGGSYRARGALEPWFYEILPVRLPDFIPGLSFHATGRTVPLFFGAAALMLAIGGLLARGVAPRLRRPALALGVIAIVLALGRGTPIFPLLWELPISHWLTGPYKWLYYVALVVALLTAIGGERLLVRGREESRAGIVLWLLAGAAALVLLPLSLAQRFFGAIVLLVALLASSRARGADGPGPRWASAGLVALLIASCVSGYVARGYRPKDLLSFYDKFSPAFRFVREEGTGNQRMYALLPPLSQSIRQAEFERVVQLKTYESFLDARHFELLQEVRRQASEGPAGQARALGMLRSLGIDYVMTPHEKEAWLTEYGLERVFTSRVVDLWKDARALPRAYFASRIECHAPDEVLGRLGEITTDPDGRVVVDRIDDTACPSDLESSGRVSVRRSETEEITLATENDRAGLLVLLDSASPDWQATVDGEPVPIRRVNQVARAIQVPEGRHEVVFRFVPRAFQMGAVLSIVALLAWAGAAWVTRRRS